jgi:hypothetical protein
MAATVKRRPKPPPQFQLTGCPCLRLRTNNWRARAIVSCRSFDVRCWQKRTFQLSQYYDTAYSLGLELAKSLPDEPVAVYAGTGKSGLFRGDNFASVEREEIKNAVKKREIRLVVATDAACEGLNLQTLGTLINVDLPWNPSRLEQRLGRIKRFGQARHTVAMNRSERTGG